MITFLKRRALGGGSVRGMVSYLNEEPPEKISILKHKGEKASIIRNDKLDEDILDCTYLVRWGCTSKTSVPLDKQLNKSPSIHLVSDKLTMRKVIQDNVPDIIPETYFNTKEVKDFPVIVRPRTHAQGKNLFVCKNKEELDKTMGDESVLTNGFYISKLINKVAEYRVYVFDGRVATVARKIPSNPDDVAWNVAQGGEFEVCRWGDWPLNAITVALKAFELSGLDFSGVDVMVDENGRAYVIELNSAPSLPLLSDGSISYRQRCMARCFRYLVEQGRVVDPVPNINNWKSVIHPGIWGV